MNLHEGVEELGIGRGSGSGEEVPLAAKFLDFLELHDISSFAPV